MLARPLRFAGYLLVQAFLLVAVLEIGLRILRPHSTGLGALLYLPSVQAHFDEVSDLESLLGQSVMGWGPFQEWVGFRLNSRSFRTYEYTEPGAPGGYRIMILGDSYTFACGGVAFRDMWHTKMSQHLNAASDRPIEVFALSVPATGTMFQLRLWQLEHERVDPDLVVVAFFVGNDLTDEQDKWVGEAQPPPLVRWSMLARLARNAARIRQADVDRTAVEEPEDEESHPKRGGYELDKPAPERPVSEMSPERFITIQANRLFLHAHTQRKFFDEMVERSLAILERFALEARDSGQEFAVLLIPEDFQVTEEVLTRSLERRRLKPDQVDVDLPQRVLGERLEALGIPVIDLLPGLRAAAAAEDLYWDLNAHWNPAGNHVAGKLSAELLSQRLPGMLEAPLTP